MQPRPASVVPERNQVVGTSIAAIGRLFHRRPCGRRFVSEEALSPLNARRIARHLNANCRSAEVTSMPEPVQVLQLTIAR